MKLLGAPDAPPTKPSVVPEQISFVLYWTSAGEGNFPVKGHLIQAKRVGTVVSFLILLEISPLHKNYNG